MQPQLADAGVVRLERSIGARLHDGTFHDGEHEGRDVAGLGNPAFAHARLHRLAPRGEILGDERMRGDILRVEFQRQAADRAAGT